eukprot:3154700-Prymnesium_polylepis.1
MLAWRHAGMLPDLTPIRTSISAPCAARARADVSTHTSNLTIPVEHHGPKGTHFRSPPIT